MPTYEYVCDACRHEFEKEQRISEDPIKKCPKCGKNKAHRLITQGNFILKGGGWYSDLYSGASNKKSSPSEAKESSSSSSSEKKESSSSPKDSTPSDTPKKETQKKDKSSAKHAA